ncbi:unannotated protein [freshwater metagenome]|uniref:Unannotated protein n=1 Tax=freshwater metagenome TaxID=449393 RepID=A0A6J6QUR7_9ZZZZ
MDSSVKFVESFMDDVQQNMRHDQRPVAEHIIHYYQIGKVVEDNPELPYEFIKEILESLQERSNLLKK